jgi:hypothetical protein
MRATIISRLATIVGKLGTAMPVLLVIHCINGSANAGDTCWGAAARTGAETLNNIRLKNIKNDVRMNNPVRL